jgi:hypothetical protein
MALHGNWSVLHKSPAKFMGGGTIAGARANWNKHGGMRNLGLVVGMSAADTLEQRLHSIPHGQGAPGAWVFPHTTGQRHGRANIVFGAAGTGALGRNMAASASISITLPPFLGALISGGSGSASIIISAVGSITATLGAPGMATISISASATKAAIGWLIGNGTVSIDGTLISYARGHMQGTTEESGLTPTGVANAVWNKIIEAGYSANEVLRLLAAHAAGDADGLEGATTTFDSLDGSKTRITGSVAAGTRTITARDVT